MYKNFDLAAVIPVRLGSSRVAQKALLPVGDEGVSLLAWKIRQLKKVMPAENIYVSTEAEVLKEIAENEGVQIHHRDYYLADGHKASFSEVIVGIVKEIPHEHIAWVTTVVPLMSPHEYLGAFEVYKAEVSGGNNKFDSLMAVNLLKEYLWNEENPINYKATFEHTISQDLPNIYKVTNGLYMNSRENMLKLRYLLGARPYKYVVSKIAGIDIDEYEDYEMAKGLFGFYSRVNNEKLKRHVFLDFDGLIANSVREAYVVAVHAEREPPVDRENVEYSLFDQFAALRYHVGAAWNYYYLLNYLRNNIAEPFETYLPRSPSEKALEFERRFFSARNELRTKSWDYWIKLTTAYESTPAFIDMINHAPSSFSIVTTKDEGAVHSLLQEFGARVDIPVYGETIFSRDGSKAKTIAGLMKSQGIDSALYIDDSAAHLAECKQVSGVDVLQAKWGYVAPGEQKDNSSEILRAVSEFIGGSK